MMNGANYYLFHLRSCAVSSPSYGHYTGGGFGADPYCGGGFTPWGLIATEGWLTLFLAALNLWLHGGRSSIADVGLFALAAVGFFSGNPLVSLIPSTPILPRIPAAYGIYVGPHGPMMPSSVALAAAPLSLAMLPSSVGQFLGQAMAQVQTVGPTTTPPGGPTPGYDAMLGSTLPVTEGPAFGPVWESEPTVSPLVPYEPFFYHSWWLDEGVAAAVGALMAAALPYWIYRLLVHYYPSQQGPARLGRLRAFLNVSDILLAVCYSVLVHVAFGTRWSCFFWSLGAWTMLKRNNYHGPQSVCAATTFCLLFGMGRTALISRNLMSYALLSFVCGLVALALWLGCRIPFGARTKGYENRMASVRTGAILEYRPVRVRQAIRGRVVSLGDSDKHGMQVQLEVLAGASQSSSSSSSNLPRVWVHLCAPRSGNPKCPAVVPNNTYHVSYDRWSVKEEGGARTSAEPRHPPAPPADPSWTGRDIEDFFQQRRKQRPAELSNRAQVDSDSAGEAAARRVGPRRRRLRRSKKKIPALADGESLITSEEEEEEESEEEPILVGDESEASEGGGTAYKSIPSSTGRSPKKEKPAGGLPPDLVGKLDGVCKRLDRLEESEKSPHGESMRSGASNTNQGSVSVRLVQDERGGFFKQERTKTMRVRLPANWRPGDPLTVEHPDRPGVRLEVTPPLMCRAGEAFGVTLPELPPPGPAVQGDEVEARVEAVAAVGAAAAFVAGGAQAQQLPAGGAPAGLRADPYGLRGTPGLIGAGYAGAPAGFQPALADGRVSDPAQDGYYVEQVLSAARAETGVSTTTVSHYISTRMWKPKNRPLKTNARVLARAVDEWVHGNREAAMDIVAGRLRAIVHADFTGKWKEAEGLQPLRSRDIGLASGRDIIAARREAKMMGSSSGSRAEEGGGPTEKKKKKTKRGKSKKDGD